MARIASILLPVISLPLMLLAQTAPPPEVEQALRARVTEFLQYHVDANFRKAYDMVAEDTKDNYFATGKVQIKGFKVDDIRFTDNFTKANVTGTISKMFNVQGVDVPVTMPSTTSWKIESGKWVWYNDARAAQITMPGLPIASPAAAPPANNANDTGGLPKELNDQTIAAAARSILQQVSVNKKEITLATDKPGEDTVIFHNGMTGSVQLELASPEIPGFTVKLSQSIVRAAGEVPVVFRYEPGPEAGRRDPVNVQLTVQPLSQIFVIRVNFAAPGPLAPK